MDNPTKPQKTGLWVAAMNEDPAGVTHGTALAGAGEATSLVGSPSPMLSRDEVIAFALRTGHPHRWPFYRQWQMDWARETLRDRPKHSPYKLIVACRVLEEFSTFLDEREMVKVVRKDAEAQVVRYNRLRLTEEEPLNLFRLWTIAIVAAAIIGMALVLAVEVL